MIQLLTLEEAKSQLRILNTDQDAEVYMKLDEASAIVMKYIKKASASEWAVANTSPVVYNIPEDITSATKLVLSELYFNRESGVTNPLSDTVKMLLSQYWDPALA